MSDFFKPINRVQKCENLSKGKDEWQKRDIEEAILKPPPIPKYTGPLPKYKCALDRRSVRIVFPSEQDMELVGKYFYIAESHRAVKYITNITLLIEFCKLLERDESLKEVFSQFISLSRLKTPEIEEMEPDSILEDEETEES